MSDGVTTATIAQAVWGRCGRWRTQLLFRGYGMCLLLTFMMQLRWAVRDSYRSLPWSWAVLQGHIANRPPEEHLVTVTALGLLVFGARGLTLLVGFVAMALLLRVNMSDPLLFPAVEFTLFAMLPAFACLALLAELLGTRGARPLDVGSARLDDTVVAVFRCAMLTTLLFVTLHKLNRDFLDPTTSCERVIAQWLSESWGAVGGTIQQLGSPRATIAVEGSLPLLLLWHPLVGVTGASLFFWCLGLVGAPSTAGIAMVMAWAFFEHADLDRLRARARPVGIAAGGILIAVAAASLQLYQGIALSRELIVVVEAMAIVPAVCAVALLLDRDRPPAPPRFDGLRRHPAIPALATAMLLANGLSPYFGWRFNYSFAMWSNLRADAVEWNSFVVPSWLQRWSILDHYVEVQSIEFHPATFAAFPSDTVATGRFVQAVAGCVNRAGTHLDLRLTVDGVEHAFADACHDAAVVPLLEALHQRPADQQLVVERAMATVDPPADPGAVGQNDPYERKLEPALFSTTAFGDVVAQSLRRHQNLTLQIAFRGQTRRFEHTLDNPGLLEFTRGLERDNLFPGKLVRSGPQPCFH